MTMQLRYYQQDCVDAHYSYFNDNAGNPLYVLPTGSGKSVIIAAFIQSVFKQFPNQRILIVSHVKELLEQDAEKIMQLWPQCPMGIYSAGLGKRQIDAQVLVAGIQSVYNKAGDVGHVDLLQIDEAHLVNHEENGMYRRFIRDLMTINPNLKVIGYTATPYRTNHGYIHEGDNTIFTDIAYEIGIAELIDQGFLAPLQSKQTDLQIDVSEIGIRAGDYIHSDLEKVVDNDEVTKEACDEIVAWANEQERKHWIIFCTGVEHAHHVRDQIRSYGITCETIVGDTDKEERATIIERYKAGEIQCITNANVLTTGFDAPHIDLVAFLRPTASLILYVQMAGRGMRLSPGKENCLVLDFAGNVQRHGPVDKVEPHRKIRKGDKGEAPTKACPQCQEIVHASATQCPACGEEFPRAVNISRRAEIAPILAAQQPQQQWFDVSQVRYARHSKAGKPDSMRVDYLCGLRTISEWICFEHEGYAAQAAGSWWHRMRDTPLAVPGSTANAIAMAQMGTLLKPVQILVNDTGKFPRIMNYKFENKNDRLAAGGA